jgi:hypothetical protein
VMPLPTILCACLRHHPWWRHILPYSSACIFLHENGWTDFHEIWCEIYTIWGILISLISFSEQFRRMLEIVLWKDGNARYCSCCPLSETLRVIDVAVYEWLYEVYTASCLCKRQPFLLPSISSYAANCQRSFSLFVWYLSVAWTPNFMRRLRFMFPWARR